ncbi:site-specific integrase, partial [Cryptosporangium minutisporangium]
MEVVEDGKKKRKQKETQSYATPNEAYEAGVLIKAQQIQGTYIDEKNLYFAQWADKWLEMYEEKEKKDHTIFARRSQVRLLKKEFGHMRLKDITSMHYQSYLYKLKKDGKKKNTILATHAVMVMIAKKAVYPPFELISKDFTLGVELPEFKNTLDKLKGSKTKLKFLEK